LFVWAYISSGICLSPDSKRLISQALEMQGVGQVEFFELQTPVAGLTLEVSF